MKGFITFLSTVIILTAFSTSKLSAQITDLQTLKNLYTSAPGIVLPSAILSGVVISDTTNKNLSKGNSILQCGNRGISLYLGVNTYTIGDSITINVTGDSLILYKNALEIKRAKGAVNPAPIATGVSVAPVVMTIQDIVANIAAVQCTLVQVLAATASPAGTFSGSKTLTDASGNFTLYTASGATFSGSTMPTTPMDWVGYTVIYNTTNEFAIRNLNDISFPLPLTFKAFSASTEGLDAILKWTTASEVNTDKIVIEKSYDGVHYNTLNSVSANGAAFNSYAYTDISNKNNTVVYYRLRSVDKDGKSIYSEAVKASFTLPVKLTAYPNPTVNSLKLSFDAFPTTVNARVVNVQGKTVEEITIPAANTIAEINVAELAAGVYHIQIVGNNIATTSTSFIKQ